jgi:DNA-binding CsgD family transcriptional regulator
MADIWRVADWRLPTAIGPIYEGLLSALPGGEFGAAVRAGVDALTSGARRLYLFEAGPNRDDDLRYHHCEPGIAALLPVYCERYKPLDPIGALYGAAPSEGDLAVQRVRPADIASVGFRRRFFDEPGIIERISVLQRGRRGWRGLNVVRHESHGPCSDRELDAIAGLARLALPMLPLAHAGGTSSGMLTAIGLEERFAARCPDLTPRERQVCARAALGMSVEATALELGIAKTSVVTFRQRAYRRLGVTSPFELCRLVAN